MKDQYVVFGRINKRGKAYYIVFDNIAKRGVMGKGNYSSESAAKAEAERLNAIARARIPAPLERGEHGNKVVLFKSEFSRMKAAVEENEDLKIDAEEGRQAKNDLRDLRRDLPAMMEEIAQEAAKNTMKRYEPLLKAAVEENNKLREENKKLRDFIKNNL